jgi:hypothetical protein
MFRIRHTSAAQGLLDGVQDVIERADRDFERAAEFFRSLAGKQIRSAKRLRDYVDAVFPPPAPAVKEATKDEAKVRRIFLQIQSLFEMGRGNDLPGVKGTAWAAYNAVTEYLTWERGSSNDGRLDNLWLGGNRRDYSTRAIGQAQKVLLAA